MDREKVIKGLEWLLENMIDTLNDFMFSGYDGPAVLANKPIIEDALALLKAQEQATIEPKRIDLADETKAWLDKMDAVDALENISSICLDWDGYRTANGLGGLINEIWAYARYCADRLLKAQEPVEPVFKAYIETDLSYWQCGACGAFIFGNAYPNVPAGNRPKYCGYCGRAVKWE